VGSAFLWEYSIVAIFENVDIMNASTFENVDIMDVSTFENVDESKLIGKDICPHGGNICYKEK